MLALHIKKPLKQSVHIEEKKVIQQENENEIVRTNKQMQLTTTFK
jgi:hypothetical protein